MPRFRVLGATQGELEALQAQSRMRFILDDEDPEFVLIIRHRGINEEEAGFDPALTLLFSRSAFINSDTQFASVLAVGIESWQKRNFETRHYRSHLTKGVEVPFRKD